MVPEWTNGFTGLKHAATRALFDSPSNSSGGYTSKGDCGHSLSSQQILDSNVRKV
jgi:hypothetical protein